MGSAILGDADRPGVSEQWNRMIEPTQVLVKKYFEEVEGYFLRDNTRFPVPGNYSDLDLVGVNSQGQGLLVEVKGWGFDNLVMSTGKGSVDWLVSPPVLKAASDALRGAPLTRKVLVGMFVGERGGPELKEYARQLGVEVMTVDTMFKELFKRLDPRIPQDVETMQMLRILKLYSDKNHSVNPPIKLEFT